MKASNEEYSCNVYCRKVSFTEKSHIGCKLTFLFEWLCIFIPFIIILLIVQSHWMLDSNSDTIKVSFKNRHFIEAIFSSGLATLGYHYSPMVKHSWLLIVPWMMKAIHYWYISSIELINMNLIKTAPEDSAVSHFLRWSLRASHQNEDANLIIEKDVIYVRKHFIVGVLLLQNIIVLIFVITAFRRLQLIMAIRSHEENRDNSSH